jgi:hypothetical protein
MLKYGFISIVISLLLFGCSSTNSFEGNLFEKRKGYLKVDCSDEVTKGENNVKDIGYLCTVLVSDKTAFMNKKGEKLSVEEISEGANLKIILDGNYKISKNEDTREVKAQEVLLLNE